MNNISFVNKTDKISNWIYLVLGIIILVIGLIFINGGDFFIELFGEAAGIKFDPDSPGDGYLFVGLVMGGIAGILAGVMLFATGVIMVFAGGLLLALSGSCFLKHRQYNRTGEIKLIKSNMTVKFVFNTIILLFLLFVFDLNLIYIITFLAVSVAEIIFFKARSIAKECMKNM